MKNLIFLLFLCLAFSASDLNAQRENSLHKNDLTISSEFLLDEALYGLGKEFALQENIQSTNAQLPSVLEKDYQYAIAQIKMDESKAANLALLNTLKYDDFQKEEISNEILGDFYFIRNDFKQAIEFYESAHAQDLSSDIAFRKAYSYFVLKDFQEALQLSNSFI